VILRYMFESERANLDYGVQVSGMADENDIIGSASEIVKGNALLCVTNLDFFARNAGNYCKI
jgi:hypothetical protein